MRSASAGLSVLGQQGGFESGELWAAWVLLAGRPQPGACLGFLALFFQRQDGELLGSWGCPCPAGPANRRARCARSYSPSCTSICASRTSTVALDSGLAGRDGLLELARGLVQVFGRPSRLEYFASKEMESRGRSSRGALPAATCWRSAADDWLGLFRIASLEDVHAAQSWYCASRLPSRKAFCRNWRPRFCSPARTRATPYRACASAISGSAAAASFKW